MPYKNELQRKFTDLLAAPRKTSTEKSPSALEKAVTSGHMVPAEVIQVDDDVSSLRIVLTSFVASQELLSRAQSVKSSGRSTIKEIWLQVILPRAGNVYARDAQVTLPRISCSSMMSLGSAHFLLVTFPSRQAQCSN